MDMVRNRTVEESFSTVPPTVAPVIYGKCINYTRQSDPFKIGDKYAGIPLNLLTNLIGWFVLLVLFVFIRKNAVKRMGIRFASTTVDSFMTTHWCSIFFGR